MTSTVFDPPELGRCQPYTMCHSLRLVDPGIPQQGCHTLGTPAVGTSHSMEFPDVPIRLCLTAPVAVQRAARLQGVAGVVQIRPAGLVEALQRSRDGVQDSQGVVLSPAARASMGR